MPPRSPGRDPAQRRPSRNGAELTLDAVPSGAAKSRPQHTGRPDAMSIAPTLYLSDQELVQATVTRSPHALSVIGLDGKVLLWNPAAERLFGWSASEVVGNQLPTIDETTRGEFSQLFQSSLHDHDAIGVEVQRRHRDGHMVDVALSTVALHDSSGKVVATLGSFQDITARKAAEAELVRQAWVDDLTGLVNRNGLLAHLRHVHPTSRRQIAVVAIELDHFEQVIAAFGHPVGEQLLGAFASRLRNAVRPDDVVARLEGAAFSVIMVGIDLESLETAVARLLGILNQTYSIRGNEIEVVSTAGVAIQYRRESPAEVVRRSGVALHYAKQVSRGSFQVLDEALDQAFQDRVKLSTGLHGAAQRGELRLHFQPIVSAVSAEVVGVEALVRWQHPTLGLLSPDKFIALAEETGSIADIGRWVLIEACSTLQQWTEANPAAAKLSMSVNLSVAQLQDRTLVDDVRTALKRSRVEPKRLHLEVTESVLITDPASTARALSQLRDLGVTLAIDDFGTGNSSLTALQRFPFQVLKIDRSFVSGIGTRPGDTTIVAATLALAHGLGLRVVAEGVETQAQADFLTKDGCEELQGFLFGRPEPAGSLHPVLALQGRTGVIRALPRSA